jgi:hypothetical protein
MIDLNNQNWVEGFVKESSDLGLGADETRQLLAHAAHIEMYKSSEAYREGFDKIAKGARVPSRKPALTNEYAKRDRDKLMQGETIPFMDPKKIKAPAGGALQPSGAQPNIPGAGQSGKLKLKPRENVPSPTAAMKAPKPAKKKKSKKTKSTAAGKPTATQMSNEQLAGKLDQGRTQNPYLDQRMGGGGGQGGGGGGTSQQAPKGPKDSGSQEAAAGAEQAKGFFSSPGMQKAKFLGTLGLGSAGLYGAQQLGESYEDEQRRKYMDSDEYMQWKMMQDAGNPGEVAKQLMMRQRMSDEAEKARLKQMYPHWFDDGDKDDKKNFYGIPDYWAGSGL